MRATASGIACEPARARWIRRGQPVAAESKGGAPVAEEGTETPGADPAPRAVRASTMEPVPARTRSPARSPMAPRYAASTSESTVTRRPS